jgi:hypothetical protein
MTLALLYKRLGSDELGSVYWNTAVRLEPDAGPASRDR